MSRPDYQLVAKDLCRGNREVGGAFPRTVDIEDNLLITIRPVAQGSFGTPKISTSPSLTSYVYLSRDELATLRKVIQELQTTNGISFQSESNADKAYQLAFKQIEIAETLIRNDISRKISDSPNL